MKINPLVSVIIPTRNSEEWLDKCLKSIKVQSYKNLEIIVVDNASTDKTSQIARKYTKLVFNKGPERSTQRNFGAIKSNGDYLFFIDSDMELTKNVVKDCVQRIQNTKLGGLIIPEISVGEGFWSQCKALERSFYLGVDWIEAARFFPRKVFDKLKGYDETLISGEDWDLSQRVGYNFKIGRIKSTIKHNEGKLSLVRILSKKFYYGKKINKYVSKNKNEFASQSSIFKRFKLFFSNPKKLFSDPILGFGMLFMKTSEFGAGALGYLLRK